MHWYSYYRLRQSRLAKCCNPTAPYTLHISVRTHLPKPPSKQHPQLSHRCRNQASSPPSSPNHAVPATVHHPHTRCNQATCSAGKGKDPQETESTFVCDRCLHTPSNCTPSKRNHLWTAKTQRCVAEHQQLVSNQHLPRLTCKYPAHNQLSQCKTLALEIGRPLYSDHSKASTCIVLVHRKRSRNLSNMLKVGSFN